MLACQAAVYNDKNAKIINIDDKTLKRDQLILDFMKITTMKIYLLGRFDFHPSIYRQLPVHLTTLCE